jgi:hypothetical protein
VSYPIIHIPIWSCSNEIKDFVVIFIHLQLILARVVECIGDHVHLLDDPPNSVTLGQKIVTSLVFPVTEILDIEDHKLNSTFLHVAFGSQSLLKSISDQTGSDTN